MYGKMQESGLIKIIFLIYTLAIWGPIILYSQNFPGAHHREWLQCDGYSMAGILLPWGSPAHIGGLQFLIPFFKSSLLGQEFDQYLEDISRSTFVPWHWEAHPSPGKNSWYACPGVKFWTRPQQQLKILWILFNYNPRDIFSSHT